MLLQLQNISKKYRTEEIETLALQEINFTVQPGEFIAIMGPSGCGKSTLLNILGLLDQPDSGKYIFRETETAELTEKSKSDLRKKNIGFIFQNFNLIDELNVYENIELPLIYQQMPASERKSRVEEVLQKMEILHRKNHFPQQLSGGQQQRVAVARALVIKPQLILADEPTGNLDSRNGDEVMRMLTALNREGTTVLMVTHSPEHSRHAGRIIQMMDGKVIAEHFTSLD